MSAETIDVRAVFEARDQASPTIRTIREGLAGLERQVQSLNKLFSAGPGADLARSFDGIASKAKALGTTLDETGERTVRTLKADTAAALALRDAYREVAAAQDAVARGAGRGAGGRSGSGASSGGSGGNGRPGGRGAAANPYADIRARWRVREASERAERREIETTAKAAASAAAARARADEVALSRKLAGLRYGMRVREASETAELRHLAGIRREHETMRRRASTAGRRAISHGRHAINSVNHPVLQSPGFWLHAGAVFGAEAGKHLLESARSIDAATARYRMMPGVTATDAASVRANALREGMRIGLDPAEVVRLQLQGIKDGLSKDIAGSLPAIVNAAVQTMGGSIDRDGDELAKAVREAFTVGWVKDAPGARSLMNSVAGLSTFNGNSPDKMQQFLASGGIGRGKELGWTKDQTLAFGAALNGSGERTGLGSARLMAQIPEIRASMRDRYVKATRSHENSEENRAVRAAPRLMGYGSVGAMQSAFATPEGVSDFLSRLGKLPEQTRAAIEKGYGLGPQFNAVAAEMGADHGRRYHEAFKRETELSSQTADNDDLAKNSKTWSGSIDFMIGQLKASVSAIQSELGDVIKDDILTPFTKWWVEISEALLNGGMKARFHRSIQAFVEGLGFSDVAAALEALRGSVGTFDFPGFMRGIGEGTRAFLDEVRSLASVFGGAGGMDARTVGKLAAELFGLSLSLHVMAPFVTTIVGFASGILAVKAVLEGAALVSELTGLSGALKAIVGAEVITATAGLLSFAGAIGVIGVAIQGLMSTGVLPKVTLLPKDTTAEGLDSWLWGKNKDGTSARPAWVDRLTGGGAKPGEGFTTGPHGGLVPLPQAYQGGGANWRDLLQPASYSSDDETIGDRDRDTAAMIGTSRAAQRIADTLDKIMTKGGMVGTMSSLSTVAGFGGGGGEGGGRANMRYGRGAAGGWRSTPGTGSYGNPSKSLLDLIAKSEGAGYNVSWGNGRFLPGGHEQNLTGKTLNEILALGDVMRRQPGARNSSAMGRYQITGSTLRDLMRRMGLSGNEKYDEAMQDRLASKLISDEGPRALQRWEGLKRGSYMSQAQALLRSGSIASQPGIPGGGAGEAAGNLHLMGKVVSEQCVALANAAVGFKGSVRDWRKGAGAADGTLKPGTPVATFLDRMGRETDRYAGGGIGTPGAHLDHAGIFQKYLRDAAGKIIGMQIAEQYKGSHGVHLKNYAFGQGFGEGNGSNYHAVMGPDGKPLGGSRNPLSGAAPPTVAGVTKAVPHPYGPNGRQPPAAGHGGAVTTADSSMTIHNTFHVHGAHDPERVARTVMAHIESRSRRRYVDA